MWLIVCVVVSWKGAGYAIIILESVFSIGIVLGVLEFVEVFVLKVG